MLSEAVLPPSVSLQTSGGWWQPADILPRYLTDLIRAELRRLRPGEACADPVQIAPSVWRPSLALGESGLGLDSLERLQLAAAVSEALHLHESGIADTLLARPVFGDWCAIAAKSLQRFSATVTVQTSGSTGAPKSCPHQLAGLKGEARVLAAILPGHIGRIVSAVPCHHIYGFIFTILLPAQLGGVPVLDIRGHSPGALPTLLRRGDLVVGHPEFWAAAMRAVPSGWPTGVTGVTSTAPCPAEVAEAVTQAGVSQLLQIHGSSETAGVGWRYNPHAAYTLMPQWDRETGGRLQRTTTGAAVATVAAPDRMVWLDPRHYQLSGRRDGAVQVAGVNVFPDRIGAVLHEHPGVAAVAVRLMQPAEGTRLKAFVVPLDPAGDTLALRRELTALATARLATEEQPRAYDFGPALPGNELGKATDWPVASSTKESLLF